MEKKVNRWEIKKMNVVNYWKFINETFYFKNGKLFFTGSNGSGKSNLTQLFPFMIDGNKRPERLNATGNKEKRYMSFYFKPKDEKGNIIKGASGEYGYICLEFKKRYTEQFLTLCIAQKYTANSDELNFYSFILKDGRRVGIDFNLFKKENDRIIPYEFKELKNELKLKEEEIFTTREKYVEAVNRELFGFEDSKELIELCNIILKMRTSLFTNMVQTSQVKEILMGALPSLEEKEFDKLTDIFQTIEDNKNLLESYVKDKKLIFELNKKYNLFNKAILYNKYCEFNSAKLNYEDFKKELENQILKLKKENMNKEKNEEQIKNLQNRLSKIEANIQTLKEAKLYKDIEKFEIEINILEKEIRKLDKQIDYNNNILSKKNEEILNDEKEINKLKTNQVENKKERGKIYNILKEKNLEIKFKDHLEIIDYKDIEYPEIIKKKLKDCKLKAENYQKDILECWDLLKNFEVNKEKFDEAKSKLDDLMEESKKLEDNSDFLEKKIYEEKGNIIDSYYSISEGNKFLKLSNDSLNLIKKYISDYNNIDGQEIEEVKKIINHFYQIHEKDFNTKINDINLEIKEGKKDLEKIKDELKILKNQKEILPSRKSKAILCRKQLTEKNIKYISLYEGIDFNEKLDEYSSTLLEKQLIDSGILDSLIISYKDREKAKDILKVNTEIILNVKKKNNNFNLLTPEKNLDEDLKEIVIDFLSSISTDENDKESQYVISKNGYFRNGIIEGYSSISNKDKFTFIGVNRRKEKLKETIIEKENEEIKLEIYIDELRNDIKMEENNLDILLKEKKSFPYLKQLNQLLNEIDKNNDKLKFNQKQLELARKNYNKINDIYEDLLSKKEKRCKIYSFKETSNVYYSIYEKIGKYIKDFENLIENINKYDEIEKEIFNIKTNITTKQENIKNIENTISIDRENRTNKFNKKESAKNYIEGQDRIELTEKLTTFENQKKEIENNISLAKEQNIKIGVSIEGMIKNIDILKEKNIKLEETFNSFKSYLQAELDERIFYFTEKEDKKYIIESISQLKDILKEWIEKESIDIKTNLESLDTEIKQKVFDVKNRLEKWKINIKTDFSLKTKFENPKLNNRLKIFITLDNEKEDLIYNKIELIDNKIDNLKNLINQKTERLIKNVLSKEIGNTLLEMIKNTSEIIKNSSNQMEQMPTPIIVSMKWEIKDEIKEIKEILQKSVSGKEELISERYKRKLQDYILKEIENKKDIAEKKKENFEYKTALKEIFDYRKWFNLKIYYQKRGENKKEAKDNTVFSGGEKAMIVYLPILSALNFKYSKANPDSFKLIVLDEAFSVSDKESIKSTMELIENLDFDFIFNSPNLRCLVPNSKFSIYTLNSSKETGKTKTSFSYWDGIKCREFFYNQDIEKCCEYK